MLDMSVTDETSQESRGWLKAKAPLNIARMSVTDETSQPVTFPLKELVLANISLMSVTDETSQEETSALKDSAIVEHLAHVGDPGEVWHVLLHCRPC